GSPIWRSASPVAAEATPAGGCAARRSAYLTQRRGQARQHAGQHFGDIAQEQGAQRALVVLRVGTADGQHAQLALIAQADDRGGADLLAVFPEQELQLGGPQG